MKNSNDINRALLKPVARRLAALLDIADAVVAPFTSKADQVYSSGNARNILVFDPGMLGDMMMLVPFLRKLRNGFPNASVTLLGRPRIGEMLLDRGLVDECLPIEIPWGARASRLQRNNLLHPRWLPFVTHLRALQTRSFDLAFATGWASDIRGNFALWLTGARRRVGYGYAGGGPFLTDIVRPDLHHPHVVDRNLRLLDGFVAARDEEFRALPVSLQGSNAAQQELRHRGVSGSDVVIGIHSGAGSPVREWGDSNFLEVTARLMSNHQARVLWFCDPAKPLPELNTAQVIPVAVPLNRLPDLIACCDLFLCNDSGPMHIASAVNVPTVAVFGPTRSEWFGPWSSLAQVAIRGDISCRPCGDNCRFSEPFCMRLITVDHVVEKAEELIAQLYTRRELIAASR